MTSETEGRVQQLFTKWQSTYELKPFSRSDQFDAFRAGYEASGVEKLRAEIARLNRLLYGK